MNENVKNGLPRPAYAVLVTTARGCIFDGAGRKFEFGVRFVCRKVRERGFYALTFVLVAGAVVDFGSQASAGGRG